MDITFTDDPHTPAYESPLGVGSTASVTGLIAANNAAGGTVIVTDGIPSGVALRVTKAFWDYETGWRYHGVAADQAAESLLSQKGAVPRAGETEAKAYFSEHDIRRR